MYIPLTAILPMASMSALLTMTIQRKHLLMALLSLEAMILTMTLVIPTSLAKTNPMDAPLMLIILTFGACEACLGLACLVSLMRLKGNDMIKSSSSNKC